jgi:hypothetical protein
MNKLSCKREDSYVNVLKAKINELINKTNQLENELRKLKAREFFKIKDKNENWIE